MEVLKKPVHRVYFLRVVDIIANVFIIASAFIDWRAAVVCFGGFILFAFSNTYRSTREIPLWSKGLPELARRIDKLKPPVTENKGV